MRKYLYPIQFIFSLKTGFWNLDWKQNVKGLKSRGHGFPPCLWKQRSHRGTQEGPDGGRQSGCCIYRCSAASPCPSRILFCVPGGCFVVSLRTFLSLHSSSHTELFVFTNAFGEMPTITGLRKLIWPLFLECPFYLVVSDLKNYSSITANRVMLWNGRQNPLPYF